MQTMEIWYLTLIMSSSLYWPPCFIIINFCFFKALLVHVTTGSLILIAILPNQILLSQLFEHNYNYSIYLKVTFVPSRQTFCSHPSRLPYMYCTLPTISIITVLMSNHWYSITEPCPSDHLSVFLVLLFILLLFLFFFFFFFFFLLLLLSLIFCWFFCHVHH